MEEQKTTNQVVLNLAGSWKRINARLFDWMIITIAFFFVFQIVTFVYYLIAPGKLDFLMDETRLRSMEWAFTKAELYHLMVYFFANSVFLMVMYILLMVWLPVKFFKGATLGKKISKIRVLLLDGEELGFMQYLKRESLWILAFFLVLNPLTAVFGAAFLLILIVANLIMMFSGSLSKNLNDQIVNSLVIENDSEKYI